MPTIVIDGRASGTTQDILVDVDATMNVYALQYDSETINGTLTYLEGDRASVGDIADDTVTGTGADTQIAYWTGDHVLDGDATLLYDYTNHVLSLSGTNTPGDDGDHHIEPGIQLQYVYSDDNNPYILGYRAKGTYAAPDAVDSGNVLMRFSALGYGATGFASGSKARVDLTAAEDWTDAAQGTKINLWTTPTGGSTTAAIVAQFDQTGIKNVITNTYQTKDYTLTIPATGTVALLATANVFTTVQTVQVATTSSKGLILKTTDNNTTNNLLEIQNSGGTAIDFIRADGTLDLGYTNIPTTSNSMVDIQKRDGATSGTSRGARILLTPYTNSNSSATYYGLTVTVIPAGGDPNFTSAIYGASYAVQHGRTGTIAEATGQINRITNSAGGTFTDARGTQIYVINSGAGTVTRGYGVDIQAQQTHASGTLATFYAFYIRDIYKPSGGTVTNQYGLYILDQTQGGTYNSAITTNAGLIVFNEGGDAATDVRIEGDTATSLFFTDASANAVEIGTTTSGAIAKFYPTEITFNEGGSATIDFRVESDTEANMIFLDSNGDTDGALYLGGSTNGLKVNKGGEFSMLGTATVWDDLRVVPGSFDRPGVADPGIVSYTPTGSSIATYLWEFEKNDIASFTVQLPHSYDQGEDIKVHIHWTPGLRGNEENGATVGWKVDYTWANIDGTFGAMSTADLSDACDGTDDKHQMTPEVTITGTGKNISSMLICNVKRTDTGADDTWAGTASGQLPMLLEIDFHFPMDTIGSKLSSSK